MASVFSKNRFEKSNKKEIYINQPIQNARFQMLKIPLETSLALDAFGG